MSGTSPASRSDEGVPLSSLAVGANAITAFSGGSTAPTLGVYQTTWARAR